jgi:hypothetical protein
MAIGMGGLWESQARTTMSWWRVTLLHLVPRQVMPVLPVMDELRLLVLLVMTEVSVHCWSRIHSQLLAGRSYKLIVLTFHFF